MSTRVFYETYDASSYLEQGNNVAVVCLGNGWYYQNDRLEDEPYSYGIPRFIAQIEIEFIDGSKKIIHSDESWKSSYGPIIHNGLYNGEIYDARLRLDDWDEAGFDDSNWMKAEIVRAPDGMLKAQMSPPDRIIKTIRPVSLSLPKKEI